MRQARLLSGYWGLLASHEVRRRCHHVVKSSYRPVNVPPLTVTDFVWAGLGVMGDRPAIVAADTGTRVSYAELRSRCKGLASWLHNNLPPHSVLAVLLPNSADFAVATLGALEAGLIVSALNPEFTDDELTYLFRMTKTSCVVTTSKKIFTVLEAKARLEREARREFSIKVIAVDRDIMFNGVHYLEELVKNQGEVGSGKSEETALLVPVERGAKELSHASLIASCRQLSGVTKPEAKIAALPPMHLPHGLTQVLLGGLSRGATLITFGELHPEQLVGVIRQHGVTALPVVAGLVRYLTSGSVPKEDLSGLRSVTLVTPPSSLDFSRLLEILPAEAELVQLYGPSHGSLIFHHPRTDLRFGSVGKLLPSTEAKVVNKSGDLEASGQGEICVRGPQLSTDSWVATGDIGYYDSDGFFYITGHVRDRIKTFTEEVYPAEIERILVSHPDVREAAVIGVPHAAFGEVSLAIVVPKDHSYPPTSKEIRNYVATRSAPYKHVSNVIFTKTIPRDTNGKVDKALLKKLYSEKLEPEIVTLSYI